jgi:hypothetical protein
LVIILNEFAVEELNDAVEFYNLQVDGLGSRFKDDIKNFILHKFPYKILYSIETDYIYVIAIVHMHRRPQYWAER